MGRNKTNPVKKNMDKKSESEKLQDELEPIWHPTEYDESDDIEDAKRIIPPRPEKTFQPFNGGKGG